MRPFLRPRHLLALLPLVFGLASAGSVSGCSTDPVNPDACKDIESARCEAAPYCDGFGSDFDVDGCKRFYRDQCLKGLRTDTDPGQPKIDACVRAIKLAGACAESGQTTPCNVGTQEISDACDLISSPQDYAECGFLDDYYEEGAEAGAETSLSPFQDAATESTTDVEQADQSTATDAQVDADMDSSVDAGSVDAQEEGN